MVWPSWRALTPRVAAAGFSLQRQVEAENVPELSEQFEVTAVPTVVLLKVCHTAADASPSRRTPMDKSSLHRNHPALPSPQRGKLVERVNGANAPELAKKVKANAAVGYPACLTPCW